MLALYSVRLLCRTVISKCLRNIQYGLCGVLLVAYAKLSRLFVLNDDAKILTQYSILSTLLICSTMLSTVYLGWSLFSRTVGAKCLCYTQYDLIYYWCKCQCLRYTQYGLCVVELLSCQNAYAKLSTAVVYHWLSCSANADAIPSIVFVYSCHAKSLHYTY